MCVWLLQCKTSLLWAKHTVTRFGFKKKRKYLNLHTYTQAWTDSRKSGIFRKIKEDKALLCTRHVRKMYMCVCYYIAFGTNEIILQWATVLWTELHLNMRWYCNVGVEMKSELCWWSKGNIMCTVHEYLSVGLKKNKQRLFKVIST